MQHRRAGRGTDYHDYWRYPSREARRHTPPRQPGRRQLSALNEVLQGPKGNHQPVGPRQCDALPTPVGRAAPLPPKFAHSRLHVTARAHSSPCITLTRPPPPRPLHGGGGRKVRDRAAFSGGRGSLRLRAIRRACWKSCPGPTLFRAKGQSHDGVPCDSGHIAENTWLACVRKGNKMPAMQRKHIHCKIDDHGRPTGYRGPRRAPRSWCPSLCIGTGTMSEAHGGGG